MGYSSSVEIVVYGEPETFDTYMNAMKLINHRVLTDWTKWGDEVYEWHDGERLKILSFSIDDVKWYDAYEAIDAWEKDFLPKAVEAGLNWERVRIGEDPEDIDQDSEGEDVEGLLYVLSRIERNF